MVRKDALLLVDKMKAAFQLASAANLAMLTTNSSLARLLGASQVVAGASDRDEEEDEGGG